VPVEDKVATDPELIENRKYLTIEVCTLSSTHVLSVSGHFLGVTAFSLPLYATLVVVYSL
jgi:hypothetical protein